MSNPAPDKQGILATIPPCPGESQLPIVQTKVRSAFDWLSDHHNSVNNLKDLTDIIVDSIAHVFDNLLGPQFYELIKKKYHDTFGIFESANTITELLQTIRMHTQKYSHLRVAVVAARYEFEQMFNILLSVDILTIVMLITRCRELIFFGDEGIVVMSDEDIDEVIKLVTYACFDEHRFSYVFSYLAYDRPQSITLTEADKITQIFLDIIEDRDKYLFSRLPKTCEEMSIMRRTISSEETSRYHSKLASLFIFLGKREEAILALDIGKTKCLRARCENANTHEMSMTWDMIKEGSGEARLTEISRQLKQYENDATVLVYHIDHYGVLHCCILNGEVTLVSFPQLGLDELLKQTQILLKPDNTKVRRNFSFFSDTREESEVNVDPFPTALVAPENNTTGSSVKCSESRSGLELATLKLKQLNAKSTYDHVFKLLLQPIKKYIKGNKLIIIPDKFLYFLPFSRLLDEKGNTLSNKYRIQIVPTLHYILSSFTSLADSGTIGPAFFVGDPKLELIPREGVKPLSPLPHARVEAQKLAALFNTIPLTEALATKENIIRHLEKVSILHIASHGDPTFGWIYLAPKFSVLSEPHMADEDTYMLREGDLFFMKMKARLVFLSCCSTARGVVCREGVFGIARAFLTAGARSVIVTLGPIDDLITLEFTQLFYSYLCNEKSVCEALQLTMIHFQNHANLSSAPFQVFGEDIKFTKEEIKEIGDWSIVV